jgi:hypothetical protein
VKKRVWLAKGYGFFLNFATKPGTIRTMAEQLGQDKLAALLARHFLKKKRSIDFELNYARLCLSKRVRMAKEKLARLSQGKWTSGKVSA